MCYDSGTDLNSWTAAALVIRKTKGNDKKTEKKRLGYLKKGKSSYYAIFKLVASQISNILAILCNLKMQLMS